MNLRPKRILESKDAENFNLKDEINLSDSNVGNSTLKVTGYEILDNYYYTYKLCGTNNYCRTFDDVVHTDYMANKVKTTLLVLDTKLNLDKTSAYGKSLQNEGDFYENYITVECDGKESTTRNITPENLKNKIVLQAREDIKEAKKLNLVITIRDRTYKIKLR